MIERSSRDRLAKALRQYVSGVITNDDLDDLHVEGRDRGAAVVKDRSWLLYDDTHQHRARGRRYLPKPDRDEIGRWILFLHSDLEYTWPEFNFIQFINLPMIILTFGWWKHRMQNRFEQFTTAGDFSVWPFGSRTEYERALAQPKYLAEHA